jgi:hypothetical protein
MATMAIVYRGVLLILMTISLCNRQRRPDSRWQRLFKAVLRDKQPRLRGSPFTLRRAHYGRGGAGEVVVSRTVKDLVAGSGIEVDDTGEHFLKGIEQKWQLLSAA